MSELGAISPIGAASEIGSSGQVTITQFPSQAAAPASAETTAGFDSFLGNAIANVDGKVAQADRMLTNFAVDQSTPIHHVTIALEEARMAVELATQVRQRLTEGYRELMNMQL